MSRENAHRRNPGCDNGIRATDCENERAEDAEEGVEAGLRSPSFSAANPKLQHPDRNGESKDSNDGVGVEVNEHAVSIGRIEVDCDENHDHGKSPMKEERPTTQRGTQSANASRNGFSSPQSDVFQGSLPETIARGGMFCLH